MSRPTKISPTAGLGSLVALSTLTATTLGCTSGQNPEEGALQVFNGQVDYDKANAYIKTSTVMIELGGQGARCSAAVVTPTRLVTAKHCFNLTFPGEAIEYSVDPAITVAFGANPVRNWDYNRKGNVKLHPQLDLAVIELNRPVPAGFKPVPIVPASYPFKVGDTVLYAGYGGSTPNSFNEPPVLRYGKGKYTHFMPEVEYVTGEKFRSILSFSGLKFDASDQSACSGDSGGPVFRWIPKTNGWAGGWGLMGIVAASFTDACADSPYRSMFAADVRYVKDWILGPMN